MHKDQSVVSSGETTVENCDRWTNRMNECWREDLSFWLVYFKLVLSGLGSLVWLELVFVWSEMVIM